MLYVKLVREQYVDPHLTALRLPREPDREGPAFGRTIAEVASADSKPSRTVAIRSITDSPQSKGKSDRPGAV